MAVLEMLKSEFGTLSDLLRAHALGQPGNPALVYDGSTVTYADLDREVDRVAASLQRDGLGRGDIVGISALNSDRYVFAFFGSLRAGCGVALLGADIIADNLQQMVEDSGSALLFVESMAAEKLAGTTRGDQDPKLVSLDGSGHGVDWEDWLEGPGTVPWAVDVEPQDTFNIIYSSGTTGRPKGIVLPHAYRWGQFRMFQGLGYTPDSVALVSIPLYSNMTLSGFLPPLASGSTVVLMRKFDVREYLELAQRHRVTHSMLVPVQIKRIVEFDGFDQYDLSSFLVKSSGSAHFPTQIKKAAVERWPGELVEFYGMTEGGGVCTLNVGGRPEKMHTVGLPSPGHDMRVIDDEGRELAQGSIGEIVAHSPLMMTEYHRLPEETRQVEWHDAAGVRFIRTGDIGRFDEDGFLTLLDRSKDMIISGGFNVFPHDVESVLLDHPSIDDVAVVGVPSSMWGESPVAFVVSRDSDLDEEQVKSWSRDRLNKAQRLAAVEMVPDLPRNSLGKALKNTLKDHWKKSGRSL